MNLELPETSPINV
uniref:Uncharacterized protein n=1 Tax=Romanomermis culicivorax TaxID=13658 RepID=A0A915JYS8_ROMCU